MGNGNRDEGSQDPYAPLRGFENEQALLAAGRETDYDVPPEHVTSKVKRDARKRHCLAIPVRGVTKDGMPFLHFGEHQVMQSWETPYMQRLAEVATSALDKGDVLELGYGMGISGGFIQEALAQWNRRHPRKKRAHHISELNLDVAADCIRRNGPALAGGRMILHVGDWRDLLADIAGELILPGPEGIALLASKWQEQSLQAERCHHVVTADLEIALAILQEYGELIADAQLQLHVGNWPALFTRLTAGKPTPNHASLLDKNSFGGALLDTYALTADERHFNQVPALQPVHTLLADGGVLTYYGDAEKDFQPPHREALIAAGFHPHNIDCALFSFERHIQGSAYKNKYNKLNGMIIPKITAGPARRRDRLGSSRRIGYVQPDSDTYGRLTAKGSLAYSLGWFGGRSRLITEEDLVSLANKIQRLYEYFGAEGKQAVRIIEVGSGPNMGNTIAAAPFCHEYIGLERSSVNVELANKWADGRARATGAMWEGWREIAGLLYAQVSQGSQALDWLAEIKQHQPETYRTIRSWNQLPGTNPGKAALLTTARSVQQKTERQNPFLAAANLAELTRGKTKFVVADLIDEVDGNPEKSLANIQVYAETADAVLANYVHESVNTDLLGVAHSLLNMAKLTAPGGLVLNMFQERTFRYDGFLVPLSECYISAAACRALHQQVASLLPNRFSYVDVDPAEVGVVMRPGYAGAALADGIREPRLPANGKELLRKLRAAHPAGSTQELLTLKIGPTAEKSNTPTHLGYCLAYEHEPFARGMEAEYARLYGAPGRAVITGGRSF